MSVTNFKSMFKKICPMFLALCLLFVFATNGFMEAHGAEIEYAGTSGTCSWSIDTDGVLRIYPTDNSSGALEAHEDSFSAPWYDYRNSITKVVVDAGVSANENSAYLFANLLNCVEMDLTNLNTSGVTSMAGMFSNCRSLTSLNLSGFNTSTVVDMSNMFYNCKALADLNVSSFNTENVADMTRMFYNCIALTSLDLSSFETSIETNMVRMFYNTQNNVSTLIFGENFVLKTEAISQSLAVWTKEGSDLEFSIYKIGILGISDPEFSIAGTWVKSVDSKLKTASLFGTCVCEIYPNDELWIAPMDGQTGVMGAVDSRPWKNIYSITKIVVADGVVAPVNSRELFANMASCVEMDLSGLDTSKVKNMSRMFYMYYPPGSTYKTELVKLDLSNFDTSNVEDMSDMFGHCGKLTSLDVSNFNTSNVTTMASMFDSCMKLINLDISNFDTSNVTDMSKMFYDTMLTNLDVSNFNTSNVTTMAGMFGYCRDLTSLDLSNFDTSNVTNMGSMFGGCSSLTSLDLSSFDTSNVINMSSMFSECYSITSLDLGSFDTSKVINMSTMFDMQNYYGYSPSLTIIDISSFDTSNVTDMANMFRDLNSLNTIILGNKMKFVGDPNMRKVNWVKSKTVDGVDLTPTFQYETATLLTMDGSFIEGTWKVSTSESLPIVKEGGTSNEVNWILDDKGTLTLFPANGVSGTLDNYTEVGSTPWYANNRSSVKRVVVEDGVCLNENAVGLFGGLTNCVEMDLRSLDTSKATNMASMFKNCTSLNLLNLENFNTTNVKNMSNMFNGCSDLMLLNVSKFNTSNTTDMSYMFAGCINLQTLDLSSFDTFKVLKMNSMFEGSSALKKVIFGDKFKVCKNNDTSLVLGSWVKTLNSDGSISDDDTLYRTDTLLSLTAETSPSIEGTWEVKEYFLAFGATGGVLWEIDIDGVLRIYPANGISGTMNNMQYWNTPWYDYKGSVTKVVVENGVFANTDTSGLFYLMANCSEMDLSGLNTKNMTDMSHMFSYCESLKSLDLGNFDTRNVTNMSAMFSNCYALENLNVSSFDTSKVTDMGAMFNQCQSLERLDLSNFDTRNVTDMGAMFSMVNRYGEGESVLLSLNISSFDTSKVINMHQMFAGNVKLTSLDVSNFNTSNVEEMSSMFYNCKSLTMLDVSSFNTSNVEYMESMFYGCESLISLDLSNFDTSNVEGMYAMFRNCASLKTLNIKSFDMWNASTDDMFWNCNSLETLVLGNYFYGEYSGLLDTTWIRTKNVAGTSTGDETTFTTEELLALDNATTPPIGGTWVNTTPSTDGANALGGVSWKLELTEIIPGYEFDEYRYTLTLYPTNGVSGMLPSNTEGNPYFWPWAENGEITKVVVEEGVKTNTDATGLFFALYNCEEMDLSGLDTSETEVMTGMFNSLERLESLDLSNLDTSKATNMLYMFGGCNWLSSLDLSSFDTSNVTNMGGMFSDCESLTDLNLSSFDTANVENMSGMFSGCNNLSKLNLSSFDTSKVTDMSYIFSYCGSIVKLDLSGFNTSSVTTMEEMFTDVYVAEIKFNNNFKFVGDNHNFWTDDTWVKTADSAGNAIDDETEYTTDQLLTFDSTTTPTIGGTWAMPGVDLDNLFGGVCGGVSWKFDAYGTLTLYPTDGGSGTLESNTESSDSFWPWSGAGNAIKKVVVEDGVKTNTNASFLFSNLSGCVEMDLSGLDASETENMMGMFNLCESLRSLDLSTLDTGKAINMSGMFYACYSLASLDVSSFDTSKAMFMEGMFGECSSLTSLDLSSFDTSSVISMNGMFNGCESLADLNLSSFDTSSVADMSSMFRYCYSLTTLNLSSFDTANVTSMDCMFQGASIEEIVLGDKFVISSDATSNSIWSDASFWKKVEDEDGAATDSEVMAWNKVVGLNTTTTPTKAGKWIMTEAPYEYMGTYGGITWYIDSEDTLFIEPTNGVSGEIYQFGSQYDAPWYYERAQIKKVVVKDGVFTSSGYILFKGLSNCTEMDLSGLDTSNITYGSSSCYYMFEDCYSIKKITFGNKFKFSAYPDLLDASWVKVATADGEPIGTKISISTNELKSLSNDALAGTWEVDLTGSIPSIQPSGTFGGVSWEIDTDGVLRIYPTDGISGTMSNLLSCDSAPWFAVRTAVKKVVIENGVSANVNAVGLFYGMENCIEMDLSGLDASNTKDLSEMFGGCSSLTSLDLSSLDTANVTDMNSMFNGCASLTSLDLSSLDTAKVADMSSMFNGCSALTNLDLSSLDTAKVADMSSMFNGCSALTNLDLSSLDTGNVSSMEKMFYNCKSLTSLDLNNFDTTNVTNMNYMFSYCYALTSLDIGNFNTTNATEMTQMLGSFNLTNLEKIVFSSSFVYAGTATQWDQNDWIKTLNADGTAVTDDTIYTSDKILDFAENKDPYIGGTWERVDATEAPTEGTTGGVSWKIEDDGTLRIWPTDGVAGTMGSYTSRGQAPWYKQRASVEKVVVEDGVFTNTYAVGLFDSLSNCTEMDLSGLDVGNTTDMSDMFYYCTELTSLNLSGFDTSKVTNMRGMFYNCGLTSLDLSSFDTSEVTSMASMFYDCESLTSLDLSSFNTCKVTSMASMFYYCKKLANLDLSSFDTGNVTNMYGMFYGCDSLGSLDLSSFDVSNVTNMDKMFYNAYPISELNLSTFNLRSDTTTNQIFSGARIYTLILGEGFAFRGAASGYSYMPQYSWQKVLNSDGTETGDVTIYKSSDIERFTNTTSPSIGGTWKITEAGTTGGVSWMLVDGVLTIYPTNGVSGTMNSFSSYSSVPWYRSSSLVKKVVVKNGVSTNTNASYLFYDMKNCTEMDLSGLDTSNATNMAKMFYFCESLTNLDLSNFNTNKVTDMSYMFATQNQSDDNAYGQGLNLETLNLSNFNTSNVTNMTGMFMGQSSLKSLNLNNFDTSKVTKMTFMFKNCHSLTSLDISSFDTTNVTDMAGMFWKCHSLEELDLSGFNTSNARNTTDNFITEARALKKIVFTNNFNLYASDVALEIGFWKRTLNEDGTESGDNAFYSTRSMLSKSGDYYNSSTIGGTWEIISQDEIVASGITGGVSWEIFADGLLRIYPTNGISGMMDEWANSLNSTPWAVYADSISKVVVEGVVYTNTKAPYMFYNMTNCVEMDLSGLDTRYLTSMNNMFYNCSSLTELDLSGFDTRNVEYMSSAFTWCSNLKDLDISNFDTSNVVDMREMFHGCSDLTALDINNFNTGSVEDMSTMFMGCNSLKSLDVSNFNTSNVTNMSNMFSQCISLTSLDLSNFNTSKVTNMRGMFSMVDSLNLTTINSKLSILDLSSFDTRNVTNMSEMFHHCNSLTSLDLSNFDTSNVADMSYMFSCCKMLTDLNISRFNVANVTNLAYMFQHCSSLEDLDVGSFNAVKATEMNHMFLNCSSLTNLKLGNFDTSNVSEANMSNMFSGCSSLTMLDLSGLDTTNVTNMTCMFQNCKSLTTLDLNSFDTSKVTNMGSMFNGSNSLASLDLSNFDTSSVTNMNQMFDSCSSLTSLNVNSFDTTKVTNMNYLFRNCASLTSLNLSNFNTDKLTSMGAIFYGCAELTSLDLSNFNTSSVTNMSSAFYNVAKLKRIVIGNEFTFKSGHQFTIDSWKKTRELDGTKVEDSAAYTAAQLATLSSTSVPTIGGTWEFTTNESGGDTPIEDDNSEFISNDADWVMESDTVWTYTFNIFDDTLIYYLFEEAMEGYTSLAMEPYYITVNDYEVTIENTAEDETASQTGKLGITKTVSGPETDEAFEITITLAGDSISGTQPINNVIFKNGVAKISLKHGETKTFDLPAGTTYSITEANYFSYESTITPSSGTIEAGNTTEVNVLNTYIDLQPEVREDFVNITLKKTVLSVIDDSSEFTISAFFTGLMPNQEYELSNGDSFVASESGNGFFDVMISHNEEIVIMNIPQFATYQFTEQAGNYTAAYKVIDNSEEDTATIVKENGANTTKNTALATAVETADAFEVITVEFINKIDTVQSLTIRNVVMQKLEDGSLEDYTGDDAFEFTITFSNLEEGATISSDIGKFVADSDGVAVKTFYLKNGEIVSFVDIPVGAKYQIVEKESDFVAAYMIEGDYVTKSSNENAFVQQELATEIETFEANEKNAVVFGNIKTLDPLVVIRKVDADGNLLSGAHLQILDYDGFVVADWVSTTEEMQIRLPEGETFTLVEVSAPEGYIRADNIEFVVEAEDTVVTMIDRKLVTLVSSGGEGVIKIVILAVILGGISAGCIYIGKKKSKEEERKNKEEN